MLLGSKIVLGLLLISTHETMALRKRGARLRTRAGDDPPVWTDPFNGRGESFIELGTCDCDTPEFLTPRCEKACVAHRTRITNMKKQAKDPERTTGLDMLGSYVTISNDPNEPAPATAPCTQKKWAGATTSGSGQAVEGWDCAYYRAEQWCGNGMAGMELTEDTVRAKDAENKTAWEMCCACGGGSDYKTPEEVQNEAFAKVAKRIEEADKLQFAMFNETEDEGWEPLANESSVGNETADPVAFSRPKAKVVALGHETDQAAARGAVRSKEAEREKNLATQADKFGVLCKPGDEIEVVSAAGDKSNFTLGGFFRIEASGSNVLHFVDVGGTTMIAKGRKYEKDLMDGFDKDQVVARHVGKGRSNDPDKAAGMFAVPTHWSTKEWVGRLPSVAEEDPNGASLYAWTVMELMDSDDGWELLMDTKDITDAEAIQIFKRLRDMLAFAFAHGFTHGDFHNKQVMVNLASKPALKVRLLNFDQARIMPTAADFKADPAEANEKWKEFKDAVFNDASSCESLAKDFALGVGEDSGIQDDLTYEGRKLEMPSGHEGAVTSYDRVSQTYIAIYETNETEVLGRAEVEEYLLPPDRVLWQIFENEEERQKFGASVSFILDDLADRANTILTEKLGLIPEADRAAAKIILSEASETITENSEAVHHLIKSAAALVTDFLDPNSMGDASSRLFDLVYGEAEDKDPAILELMKTPAPPDVLAMELSYHS